MDYKIRVANEAESKEAQELFFELGGTLGNGDRHAVLVPSIMGLAVIDGLINFVFNDVVFIDIKQCKEITLPQLHDLVVLKRNDVSDATHHCNAVERFGYLSSEGVEYLWSWGNSNWFKPKETSFKLFDLKPITKEKPMKEYLDPENDYKFIITDKPFFDWIEIPEGAQSHHTSKTTSVNFFLMHKDGIFFYNYGEKWILWGDFVKDLLVAFNTTWSRRTAPEELPFVDNNKPWAEQQMDRIMGRESLNDQYAEIEQVRQASIADTLSERQTTYGDFKDVANTTQYLLQMLSSDAMSDVQLEALHMICSKLSRIAHGDPNHKDSWHDIAGYATLVERSL